MLGDLGIVFDVDRLRVFKHKHDLNDVVIEVRFYFRYKGVEQLYVLPLPPPNKDNFIPLEEIDQDLINKWVEDMPLNQKQEVVAILEELVNPSEYIYKPKFAKKKNPKEKLC